MDTDCATLLLGTDGHGIHGIFKAKNSVPLDLWSL